MPTAVRGSARSRPLSVAAKRLAAHTLIVFTALAVMAPLALRPLPEGGTYMPLLSPVSAADVETPEQRRDPADGRSHAAATEQTAAETGKAGDDTAAIEVPDAALPRSRPDAPEEAVEPPPDAEPQAMPEPQAPEAAGFDEETSEELVEERDE
ncbi:hypothetical protein [Streptomonospora litoralis]|uniref:hypothetical protein n=1 Tax=Streptomonospora litoralis TaxID=2498135 RepID=UPI0013F15150|nr:hypothetical protein [Streptomonospora litoralis]